MSETEQHEVHFWTKDSNLAHRDEQFAELGANGVAAFCLLLRDIQSDRGLSSSISTDDGKTWRNVLVRRYGDSSISWDTINPSISERAPLVLRLRWPRQP